MTLAATGSTHPMRRQVIFHYAITWHLLAAIGLVADPGVIKIAPLYGVRLVTGDRPLLAAALLLVISVLAIIEVWRSVFLRTRRDIYRGMLFIGWQQALLMGSAGASMVLAMRGHYADGYPQTFWFILVDQARGDVAALWHTVALFTVYRR